MPELQSIAATEVDAILEALSVDGACIATDYLDANQCGALLGDFEPHLEAMGWGLDVVPGGFTVYA